MNWIKYYTELKKQYRRSTLEQSTVARPFPICPKLTLPTVPFITWAAVSRSIYTMRGISPRRVELLYIDYTEDMRQMGFEPQGEWILDRIQNSP